MVDTNRSRKALVATTVALASCCLLLWRASQVAAQTLALGTPLVVRNVELPARTMAAERTALNIGLKIGQVGGTSRIVVRSVDSGELIGSISPFARPSDNVQTYKILVPAHIDDAARRGGGKLNLSFELDALGKAGSAKVAVQTIEAQSVPTSN